MNRYAVILIALLACIVAMAQPVTYPVYRAGVAPTIDGDVQGDPAWQQAPARTGFSKLGNGYTKVKQTSGQLLWDDKGVYVGVVCEEPDAALLKPSVRDFGDTWAEDSLEIFLMPAAQAYQFGVTAGGAKGGFEGGPDINKVQAAAKIGAGFYSVEIFVPFEAVKAARVKAGDKWRGQICRNVFTDSVGGDKFTSWTPLEARFLEPENFAILLFDAQTLQPAQVAQVTEQLNLPYRQTLTDELKEAAALGAQYKETLQVAQDDPKHGERARELLREWRRIDRLARQANQASILDTRQSLVKLNELNEQSYQLKYRYLIDKLFAEN
ncbi:MAG: sugar-binding protein [Armatimonadota bacterium]